TYHGPHHGQVENVADPGIEQADDIILRITATAISGSNLHIYRSKRHQGKDGDNICREFMTEVVETGKDVKNLKADSRVVRQLV
ncbi:alcohol dehydrogenase catalytic domain-containing protein, partial [Escherichia coli]|uniref:alcohol dehydrogenase catalytic domain-containing protein n=1 Tax=Escherichia coli TaxID=562 RepID=UPI00110B5A0A